MLAFSVQVNSLQPTEIYFYHPQTTMKQHYMCQYMMQITGFLLWTATKYQLTYLYLPTKRDITLLIRYKPISVNKRSSVAIQSCKKYPLSLFWEQNEIKDFRWVTGHHISLFKDLSKYSEVMLAFVNPHVLITYYFGPII